jgi:hypothetical protein
MPSSDADVRFGPFVRMLGHRVEEVSLGRDDVLLVEAWWGVAEAPHRAAVSFAHLLDAEGRYLAGWDGLTAPATCWQWGDLIVQRYNIPLPADLAPGSYRVEVGWYDRESLQRWICYVDGQPAGDRALLPAVEIGP